MSLNRRSNHLLRDMVMKMRSVFILLLIVAYVGPYLSQGYVYTSRYGAVLNAWGTFACAMSNAKILRPASSVLYTFSIGVSPFKILPATHITQARTLEA